MSRSVFIEKKEKMHVYFADCGVMFAIRTAQILSEGSLIGLGVKMVSIKITQGDGEIH